MALSTLQQVLDYFEATPRTAAIPAMARDLGLSPGQVESMVEFWVRKGKLRRSPLAGENCASCGLNGSCPFVIDLPHVYELVREDADDNPAALAPTCERIPPSR